MKKANMVNEILQLYRFIVDKYSSLNIQMEDGSGQSIVGHLVRLMIDIHADLDGFKGVSEHTEGNIVVMSILRIMTQIVVRVPMDLISMDAKSLVLETALRFGLASLV